MHETIKETETEPEEQDSLRSESEEDDLLSRSICSAVADSHHSAAWLLHFELNRWRLQWRIPPAWMQS